MKNFEIKNNGSLAPCGRERQSGRSMIEMLGVLAIIGVLSVGGIAGYSKAMQKYRINKTIEQITLIINNIQTFYANQKTYEGFGTVSPWKPNSNFDVIKKAKLVPDEMISGTNIVNAFNGKVSIVTSDKNISDDNKAVAFYLDNIPSEACVEIMTQDWSVVSGIIAVGINSDDAELKTSFTGCNSTLISEDGYIDVFACKKDLPLNIDEAVEYCNHEFYGNISFKFY